jgi:hypothetical protein
MTSPLEENGASLREAASSGSYAEAQTRLAEFARAVAAAVAGFPPGDSRARETVRQAIDLLHWTGRVVRAGRAHTAVELARLSAGRPYRGLATRSPPTFRLEA